MLANRAGHKSMEKDNCNLHTDRENEANMMFIIWLLLWENGNKCRKSDLTVIWQVSVNESFNSLTKTIAHYKIFPLNVQSKCKWAMLKNSYSFPAGLWKKTLHIATKLPRKVCPVHCRRNLFLWQNVDWNLCQFINVFLTVIFHKIFDQSLEYSSPVGLRFSFFISFRFSSNHKLKFGRTLRLSTLPRAQGLPWDTW